MKRLFSRVIRFLLEVRKLPFALLNIKIERVNSGCGRFFEGTPAEMHTALNKTLAALPDDTKVYVSSH